MFCFILVWFDFLFVLFWVGFGLSYCPVIVLKKRIMCRFSQLMETLGFI